jgi:stage II sporulation protein M
MIRLESEGTHRERLPPPKRVADLVRELYRDEWAMWKAHYKRYFKTAARALALGFILGFVYFTVRPAEEKKALAFVLKSLKDIPLGASPLVLALTLFYHNARASVIAVVAGVIPFVCLPVLDPVINGATLGLLASISKHQGLNVPLLFLKSVAPHGIFELPAVLYATSVGIYFSVKMGEKTLAVWRRKRGQAGQEQMVSPTPPDPKNLRPEDGVSCGVGAGADSVEIGRADAEPAPIGRAIFRSFGLVVLPLLLVAAYIESFITPLLR